MVPRLPTASPGRILNWNPSCFEPEPPTYIADLVVHMLMSPSSGIQPLKTLSVVIKFVARYPPIPEKSRPASSICISNVTSLMSTNRMAHLKPPALAELGDGARETQTSPVMLGSNSRACSTSDADAFQGMRSVVSPLYRTLKYDPGNIESVVEVSTTAIELWTLRGNPTPWICLLKSLAVTSTCRSKLTMKFTSSPAPYSPVGRSAVTLSTVGLKSEMSIIFEAKRAELDPVAGKVRSTFLPKASSIE
mmetsp:Transcript_9659/g.20407  ORF Transcript_9659/g.20407 Transcript_9659/m.20407 type:complete len:249 (-) Transcript_9659:1213-1959(-)